MRSEGERLERAARTLNLLMGFDRGVLTGAGVVVREFVKCRIWFDSAEAVDAFVAEKRGSVPVPKPHFDGGRTDKHPRDRRTAWPDYFTGPSP